MSHHPIRDLEIWHYTGEHGALAFFGDGRAFPTYFRGQDAEEAISKAEAFRAETIARHEQSFIARSEASEKAKASAARKKAEEGAR
ncbi:hypothetical protein [Antarcticirhabdus aurantiaca]|uniref:hypothetical protein n=1 Tax=Antarcticirhabdus aurantiaca TaxID=2606717 RepID=UPI00131CB28E|nr:hypothetical protein [Antarcticirhabdus aurantiaca]